jgi:hypothetical protein
MATEGSYEQQLRDAGVIISDELPQEYVDVFEGLSEDELKTILDVKTRLDQAADASGTGIGDAAIAP